MTNKRTVRWRDIVVILGLTMLGIALGVIASVTAARAADVLYIGDGDDDTVKKFDAANGNYLGVLVKQNKGGLDQPRGLIVHDGKLTVSSQVVGPTFTAGEILQYDLNTGKFLGALVSNKNPGAPFAPRGIVLSDTILFVATVQSPNQPGQKCPPDCPDGIVSSYNANNGNLLGKTTPLEFSGRFHPRGAVIGPDGLLYVSNVPNLATGLGGQVLRFDPETENLLDVFIDSKGGSTCNDSTDEACKRVDQLNRPEGLVFGPDGNLYITSFRNNTLPINDNDKILIFQGPSGNTPGAYVDRIDLDAVGQPRTSPQAILFGPDGKLFVPINQNGSVRRYDVATKTYENFVSPGGPLTAPWYLTFGKTNPSTLAYDE